MFPSKTLRNRGTSGRPGTCAEKPEPVTSAEHFADAQEACSSKCRIGRSKECPEMARDTALLREEHPSHLRRGMTQRQQDENLKAK